VNSSPLDRLNRFCLIFPQAVVPNNCAVFKNWSNDGGIPNSKLVSRKTSTLKLFEVMQMSIRSGANIVNVQIPRSLHPQSRSVEL